MNIENMEQEFPKMPQSMRDMIEKEVEKQVKITPQKGYFSLKKAVVASLAATFILGTTIFAGPKKIVLTPIYVCQSSLCTIRTSRHRSER